MESKYLIGVVGLVVVGAGVWFVVNQRASQPQAVPPTNAQGESVAPDTNPETRVIDAVGRLAERAIEIYNRVRDTQARDRSRTQQTQGPSSQYIAPDSAQGRLLASKR